MIAKEKSALIRRQLQEIVVLTSKLTTHNTVRDDFNQQG
ncbi:MAG: hypothetical protein ACI8W9_001814 [Psychromonas sp.]|jgi:hypothetical protein